MQSLEVIQDNIIKNKRILIINDDLDICAQLKNYLEQKDQRYKVEIAANLLQADSLARRFKPDITILDIKENSESLFSLLPQFKNIHPEMECIGISSQTLIKTLKQFDQGLISGYLYKPVDSEKLIDSLELLLSRQELRREKENALKKFNSLFNINHELIFDLSIDGHILDINDAAVRFINVDKSELLNQFIWETPWAELGPELIIRLKHILNNDHELEQSFDVNLNNDICDNRSFTFTVKPIRTNDGKVNELLLRGEDVTDQRSTEQQIRQISYIDQLTGLSNHAWFYQNMNTALKKADRHGRCCAILSVNIDNFSELNKKYGEHIGDAMLVEVSKRLNSCIREGDIASRRGGDRFCLFLDEISDEEDAGLVAHRIVKTIAYHSPLDQENPPLTASVGVAIFPDDGRNARSLLLVADATMEAVKQNGKNSFRFLEQD